MGELQSSLGALRSDENIHVVVLAANGPAFCSGHDMRQILAKRDRDYYESVFERCSGVMMAIKQLPQPVIAAVQGSAAGAGAQLAATCDLAFASDAARFALPGVNIGLWCSTPSVGVSRSIGQKAAMEMLLSGELIDAEQAFRFGLVNRVVPHDELQDTVMEFAMGVASRSRMAVALGKEAFYKQSEMGLQDAYRYASDVMTHNLLKDDAWEGMNAFLEKRPAEWKNS